MKNQPIKRSVKCKFKFKNGKSCKYIAGNRSKLCPVHNPNIFPLFFIKDCELYKKNDSVFELLPSEAHEYVKRDIAIEINYKRQVLIDKFLRKNLLIYKKELFRKIKNSIARKDKQYFTHFFGKDKNYKFKEIQDFINKKEFAEKEQKYLKSFINKINK